MIFYKYAAWDALANIHIRGNLERSVFYFGDPTQFNDPFELNPTLVLDVTRKATMDRIIDVMMRRGGFSREKARRFAVDAFRSHPRYQSEKERRNLLKEIADGLRRSTGVFCLTSENDNLLMWAHYADKHQGVCMEFCFADNKPIVQFPQTASVEVKDIVPLKVQYSSTRPKVDLNQNNPDDWVKVLLTKSPEWAYENEYRVFSIGYNGEGFYHPGSLTKIYAGCRMPDDKFKELSYFARKLKYQPRIFRAKLNEEKYMLEFIETS